MLTVKRTLVKSGPELWAEVADAAAMARHLSPFGSVRITRAEPERLVEWEGELARGAVRLEPSGFGTRVTITADTRPGVEEPGSEPQPEPQPAAEPQPEAAVRGVWGRLFRQRASGPPAPVEPLPGAEPGPEPEPLMPDDRARAVLEDTLEALGKAHHRPFSRV